MSAYRAFAMGRGGRVASPRAFVCGNDEQAIAWARRLIDGQDIELWNDERFVKHVTAMRASGAVSYKVINGRMVPKQ